MYVTLLYLTCLTADQKKLSSIDSHKCMKFEIETRSSPWVRFSDWENCYTYIYSKKKTLPHSTVFFCVVGAIVFFTISIH